jgi:hypothetical protein
MGINRQNTRQPVGVARLKAVRNPEMKYAAICSEILCRLPGLMAVSRPFGAGAAARFGQPAGNRRSFAPLQPRQRTAPRR